jgi:Domain of unknown function (DUF4129)
MSQFSTTHHRYSLTVLFGVLLMILFPANVAAIPINQYQENLKHAIGALETLNQPVISDDIHFDYRLADQIKLVRTILPKHDTVEFEGESCDVDNSWLHEDLDKLEQADDRSGKLGEIVWRLRAIEERVAERQNPGERTEEKKEWAKTRLESILARPEYATNQPNGPNALVRLLQDFARWLAKWLPKPRSVDPGRIDLITLIAQIIVIGLAVLLILYVLKTVIVWFSGRSRKPRARKQREARIVLGERLEPEATATDLLSEAEALARQGDLRAAIRKAYIALLVELGDRKVISLAHHKTNRDYLNSLRSVPQLHSRMRGLTESFERHWYGFASATPNDWQDFRASYLAALQTETK